MQEQRSSKAKIINLKKNRFRISPLNKKKLLSPFASFFYKFSLVQSLSHVRLFAVPWTAARQASLYITNSWSLLKIMSIKSVMPSNHLTLGRPLLLPPTIFPSIRVFLNESVLCIRWPKYWSFSFSISPSNECLGLISFRMDLLDLLQVKCIQSKKKFLLWVSWIYVKLLLHTTISDIHESCICTTTIIPDSSPDPVSQVNHNPSR